MITATETSLRRFLYGLPGVDQVGAEFRAATLATRSIKTTAKQTAIDLAISMIDLTTLEGQDTPGKVKSLCAKALRPDPSDPTVPPVAAVCVYPDLVETAKQGLEKAGACHQLRSLGLTDASLVRVCKCGDPFIIQVRTTRIGLSSSVAGNIYVVLDSESRHSSENGRHRPNS